MMKSCKSALAPPVILLAVAVAVSLSCQKATTLPDAEPSAEETELTFNKDIAPIIFENCSACHRPGEAAPFALLSYDDVKSHSNQIVDVTKSYFMPPFLPARGHVRFADERRLTDEQIALLARWVEEGTVEGRPEHLPKAPRFTKGWQLGKPDLVVRMPEPYMLPAEGPDIYRNFVIPISNSIARNIRAMELRPDNPRLVHHAYLAFDRTPTSRRLTAQDAEIGFPGMGVPSTVRRPESHSSSWQPGKVPAPGDDDSWLLQPGTDLVLRVHMQPTGKEEPVRLSAGFYFTDQPPTGKLRQINLSTLVIDIPAGMKDYVRTSHFVLPVDAEALGVLPHAHYLGKRMEGFATLPDGSRKELLRIDDWDLNWQGDYRYAKPIFLPQGTTLTMRYTFDNSAQNARNPNNPPQRVRYGPQATDEMAELSFQLRMKSVADRRAVSVEFARYALRRTIQYNRHLIDLNPRDLDARIELGEVLMVVGKMVDAEKHIRAALKINPTSARAHYVLGGLFRRQNNLPGATAAFERAIGLDPKYYKAYNDLGSVLLDRRDPSNNSRLERAEGCFKRAIALHPAHPQPHQNLARIAAARGNLKAAITHCQNALRIDPDYTVAQLSLAQLRARLKNQQGP